jgi:hypothetical protein
MALLVGVAVVINVVWKNPVRAEEGLKHFLGLPAWMLASIAFVAGAIIFWLGLKIEPDWPEAIGGFLISGSIAWFEIIVGWKKFDFGGLVVIPYLIPLLVFVLLLMYAARASK